MVQRLGTKSWAQIADQLAKEGMSGRSGKQCRERWHNHLGEGPHYDLRLLVCTSYYELSVL